MGLIDNFHLAPWVVNTVYTGAGLAALILGGLYVYQDHLLYHPYIPGVPKTPKENPAGFRSPEDHGISDYEEHFILTADGATVHAWLLLQRESLQAATVVYFHGNAGNMGFRLPHAANLYKQCKVNVILMDYRGYGSSHGKPTEPGLLKDAEAVLELLQQHQRIDQERIFLYGKSLGGAVALALMEKHPEAVIGLVLENSFLSISAMVDFLMPWVKPAKWLVLRIGWDNKERIQKITQPILFISGLADELVPPSHMSDLRRLATRSKSVEFYTVADGTHNDTMFKGGIAYYRQFRDFVSGCCGIQRRGRVSSGPASLTEGGLRENQCRKGSQPTQGDPDRPGLPVMPQHTFMQHNASAK